MAVEHVYLRRCWFWFLYTPGTTHAPFTAHRRLPRLIPQLVLGCALVAPHRPYTLPTFVRTFCTGKGLRYRTRTHTFTHFCNLPLAVIPSTLPHTHTTARLPRYWPGLYHTHTPHTFCTHRTTFTRAHPPLPPHLRSVYTHPLHRTGHWTFSGLYAPGYTCPHTAPRFTLDIVLTVCTVAFLPNGLALHFYTHTLPHRFLPPFTPPPTACRSPLTSPHPTFGAARGACHPCCQDPDLWTVPQTQGGCLTPPPPTPHIAWFEHP